MMKIAKYRYFNLILHILAWSIVLFFPYFVASADNQYKIGTLAGLYFTFSGIIHIVIFYVNALFLYPRFLNRAYWLLYVAAVILLIFLSYQVKFYMLVSWFPDVLQDARSHVLFPSVLIFIVSIFYSITFDRIRNERLQKEHEKWQLEMQLKFLRSQ